MNSVQNMHDVPSKIISYQMVQPGRRNPETGEMFPGKFELIQLPVPELKDGEVLVEIAGCGVSYEDLHYFFQGDPIAQQPPLCVGHEISGKVVLGEPSWMGKEVIVPAILPCRKCDPCSNGKTERCCNPIMSGNSFGSHSGFSSHIVVRGNDLCVIQQRRRSLPLEHLAVVANAVASAYHAVKKASIEMEDHLIVIGVGGIGQYIVQIAKALGAETVTAVDIAATRLERMLHFGADAIVDVSGREPKAAADDIFRQIEGKGSGHCRLKIIETAGSETARETAMNLLTFYSGKLVIVKSAIPEAGDDIPDSVRSDENTIDSWGCPQQDYPYVLEMVISGKISITPFIQTRPMFWIEKVFEESFTKDSEKRTILTTDDFGRADTPEMMGCR